MVPELTSPWVRAELGQWNALLCGRAPAAYRKNALIYHQGDAPGSVYIVDAGRIRITSYHENGDEKQLFIAERGAMFGTSACFNSHVHNASAVAIVDSSIYCIPFPELEQTMQRDWALCRSVLQMVCRKNSVFLKQVVDLSFADALQRVAQALLNLVAEYGSPTEGGSVISIRFTHQDVANLTNTSRVTVSNIFNFLAGEGVLLKQNGHFLLCKHDALRRMAEGGRWNG